MPQCPMCNKPLRELCRRCPTCQADLDLLVDYASFLQGGLERAGNLAKAGQLGPAIWAYLEVLDVDPDNPTARKQIAQVVTAIRQFDQQSLAGRLGQPSANGQAKRPILSPLLMRALVIGCLLAGLFVMGFLLGFLLAGGQQRPVDDRPVAPKEQQLGG